MSVPSLEHLLARVSFPAELPISEKAEELKEAISAFQVVIVAGETGSGKTTQLPKICLAAGLGRRGLIGCTQPRRIAALSVSRRIAEELGCTWSYEVGCKVRFADNTRRDTIVKVMTDGTLLSEIKSDPLLNKYEALIIDEAHERSLTIDFLIGYLRKIRDQRPELKIIITSATIDTELFSKAFDNAPVFQVSGRLYPVEIRYEPPQFDDEGGTDISYIDGALSAVEQVLSESVDGDVLIFMPTERDIRECKDRLEGRLRKSVEILPLMGSLSNDEQERVFKHTGKRKIIVSTNVAETSLTLPNIRYVIDTGLARVSRFNPRTRTKRLPIEEISKSSAQQRAGRAGRVREGVCIRLYEEKTFPQRPDFSDPEILRANLAEVILLMKAFSLGEIQEFPFLLPPEGRAIRSGIALLQELGALSEENSLTKIGRQLSQLPVDPTVGRILLASIREHCAREVIIIAAALSIKDPRERPMDSKDKAELAHRKLLHPDSDFLTLLNIWHEYSNAVSLGRAAVRRFCKENYLSYLRLREWGDSITELTKLLPRINEPPILTPIGITRFDGRYRAIHRSILSGFIGQIGFRIQRNTYQFTSGRQITIAPGSSVYERRGHAQGIRKPHRKIAEKDPGKERWIVAAEIVETERVFGRTAAHIQPHWIMEFAKQLLKKGYEEAFWDRTRQAAMVPERSILQGLLVGYRKVPFAHVNKTEARDLLIRSLLTSPESGLTYPFAEKNRVLCDKIASQLALRGTLNRTSLEESLVQFYIRKLPPIGSLIDLEYFLKKNGGKNCPSLLASAEDLWTGSGEFINNPNFPDSIDIAGASIPIRYRYEPGKENDGVTITLPVALAKKIPARALDGAIPGLREKQILHLLRALPKPIRLQIDSYTETAQRIACSEKLMAVPLVSAVIEGLKTLHSITVSPHDINLGVLPDYLRPRFLLEKNGEIVAQGRELDKLTEELSDHNPTEDISTIWGEVRATWERSGITTWDMGTLPSSIEVGKISGVPVLLFPAVILEDDRVALRLLTTEASADQESLAGINRLLELALRSELHQVEQQSKVVTKFTPLIILFCSTEYLRKSLVKAVKIRLFQRPQKRILSYDEFLSLVRAAKERLPNLITRLIGVSQEILELRRAILSNKTPYKGMREDLEILVPPSFLEDTPEEYLHHIPRYLKGMIVRAERADSNPSKDQQKRSLLEPFTKKLTCPPEQLPPYYRWMVEELKISLFAHELGTAFPISVHRMERLLSDHENVSQPQRYALAATLPLTSKLI